MTLFEGEINTGRYSGWQFIQALLNSTGRKRINYTWAQVWLCTMIVSRHRQVSSPVNISQICWPPKILRPLPWQPNFIQTLATGAISKWMTRTTEPISTYTPLNLVTLFWTWHYKHGRYAANFPVPWLVISSTSCGKWLGWNIQQVFASRWSNENFLQINKIYCCVPC